VVVNALAWKLLPSATANNAELRTFLKRLSGLLQPPLDNLTVAVDELDKANVQIHLTKVLEALIASAGGGEGPR
jgi:hypothetical protein